MIAAKAFDPVLGVDIHIIQPPGPVPPVPVPHPFVGMLIDPMDFAPVIGATVMVNGMPRATAGTGGQCIPPHIPIGGVFVKPPANECEIFMGSSTVLADGDPLSFLGMPVLSCHDIGMPPIPRLKKKRKTKSMVLPTSVVLAVPAGPPVLVGGPPTISMMALGMKVAMAGLGKAFKKLRKLQKASKKMKALSDKLQGAAKKAMDKLGVPPNIQNKVHRSICGVTGHPVDVVTGKVFTESVDFELPGLIPLRFERVWYSASTYVGPLGNGWHHCYDLALWEEGGVVAVRLADGRPAAFPVLSEGTAHWDRGERILLRRENQQYILRSAGLEYFFVRAAESSHLHRLTAIADDNRNSIRFLHDDQGRLRQIVDSVGRHVSLRWTHADRIQSIVATNPRNHHSFVVVAAYSYDQDGNLIESRDADGHSRHYHYSDRFLVTETDRNGISFHFRYDRKDTGARCVFTAADGGVYARQLTYDDDARITRVTDTRGGVTQYVGDPAGVVTERVEPSGQRWRFEYSEYAELVHTVQPDGGEVVLEYDDSGRLITRTSPEGAKEGWVYSAAGYLTTYTDPLGGTWLRTYDHAGNVVQSTDPDGNTYEFIVDSRGLPVREIDPLGQIRKFEWDEYANLTTFVDRTAATTSRSYDGWGRVLSMIDGEGNVTRFAWDGGGHLIAVQQADGALTRFKRDGEGNVIEALGPTAALARYEYGVMGRIRKAITPAGRVFQYTYDAENELASVTDARGRQWLYDRDVMGNVIRDRDFNGRTLLFEYDVMGRVTAMTTARGSRIVYRRHSTGRANEILEDGNLRASYVYDLAGRVTSAINASGATQFAYDCHGRLIAEFTPHGVTRVTYDAAGRNIARTSALGRNLTFDADEEGRPLLIKERGTPVLRLERDRLGRVVKKAGNGAVIGRTYTATGQLSMQTGNAGTATSFERRYSYDNASRLTHVTDAEVGSTSYEHDEDGRLTALTFAAERQLIDHDSGGLWPGAEAPQPVIGSDRQYGATASSRWPGGEVLFDADWNVIQKTHGDEVTRFRYDSIGMLTDTRRPDGAIVRYRYDALGRRIRRETEHDVVTYHWFGLEQVGADITSRAGEKQTEEYLFGPDLVPIVLWLDGRAHSIETDQIGIPILAVQDGKNVWRAVHSGYGQISVTRGTIRVPFRFPGQSADLESGLLYNCFRFFDPVIGGYLTPDPIGLAGGGDTHSYVPDPTRWLDPYGLQTFMSAETRREALDLAQQHAQVPRESRGGVPIGFDALNADSRARNWSELQAEGATTLGRRDGNTPGVYFMDHPDGHPHMTGPSHPPHHAHPHVHAVNAKGDELIVVYKAKCP